ncbi:MAG: hypothetical protein FWE91_00335 [Defluviitaleaceae bacterium]|nr:hypothetical protein [Defluviitaleaceae bacterium]MCL2836272.1 hypothetical protein [Defluviitaleaceae bacterium]
MASIRTSFTMRMELEVHLKFSKIAKKESRSMANMIEYILKQKIEEFEKEHGKIVLTDEDYGLE